MTRRIHEAEAEEATDDDRESPPEPAVLDPLDEEIQWAILTGRLPADFLETRNPDSREIVRSPTGNRYSAVGRRPRPSAYPKTRKFDDLPRWSANIEHGGRGSQGNRTGDLVEEITELSERLFLPPDLARKVFLGHIRLKSAFLLRWLRWRTEDECHSRRKLVEYRATCLVIILSIFALLFCLRAGVNWIVHVESMQDSARRSSPEAVGTVAEEDTILTEARLVEPTRKADLVLNEWDEITKITAGSPRDVLVDFCRFSGACLPGSDLQIARGSNKASGIRFGILRAFDGPMTLMTLTIHRHPTHRTWSAGDGRRPIMLIPEERVALEIKRVDVGTAEPES